MHIGALAMIDILGFKELTRRRDAKDRSRLVLRGTNWRELSRSTNS